MKSLILFALFIPLTSSAQKFEISEQAGYAATSSIIAKGYQCHAFSNEVKIGYHPFKRILISAFYELNRWIDYSVEGSGGIFTTTHSFGLAPAFTSKYFYAGVNVEITRCNNKADKKEYPDYIKYGTSYGYGVYAGSKQKIYKRLSITEQIGYERIKLNTKPTHPNGPDPWALYYVIATMTEQYYMRVGLCYAL